MAPDRADERSAVAASIREDLEARLAAVVEAARRVRDEDGDPEAIHDVRVATRRLSEALATWEPLLEPAAAARARRTVRRLRRRLSEPREFEVHLERMEELLPELELAARLVAEPLVERLRRRVARGRRSAKKAAGTGRIDRLVGRVVQATGGIAERATQGPDPLPPARARAARRKDAARSALAGALGQDDDALLHEARIAIKKDRYASEILSAIAPSNADASRRTEALRRLQQALGTVHDRAVLIAWIEARARRWRARGRFERALALAPLLDRLAEERRSALRELPRRLEGLDAPGRPNERTPPPDGPPGEPARTEPAPRAAREPSGPTDGPAVGSGPVPPTPRGPRPRVP